MTNQFNENDHIKRIKELAAEIQKASMSSFSLGVSVERLSQMNHHFVKLVEENGDLLNGLKRRLEETFNAEQQAPRSTPFDTSQLSRAIGSLVAMISVLKLMNDSTRKLAGYAGASDVHQVLRARGLDKTMLWFSSLCIAWLLSMTIATTALTSAMETSMSKLIATSDKSSETIRAAIETTASSHESMLRLVIGAGTAVLIGAFLVLKRSWKGEP